MINNSLLRDPGQESTQVIVLEMFHQFIKNYNYLVVDPLTRKAVIVDPAWQIEKIEDALNNTRAKLEGILLTHSHFDHIHLARPLAKKYNCPIWMSNAEIESASFSAETLVGIDEVPWQVGNLTIEPVFTPGHTVGCVCFRIGNNLFTGDTLFAEGCGLCPDRESAFAMFASLAKLKEMLDEDTRIYPGHSYGKIPGRQFSQILKENIYLQFKDRDSFSRFRLRRGQDRTKMFKFR